MNLYTYADGDRVCWDRFQDETPRGTIVGLATAKQAEIGNIYVVQPDDKGSWPYRCITVPECLLRPEQ